MNKIAFLSAALVSTFIGCNAQQVQTRPLSPFTKIETSGSVNVFYTNSDTLGLTVKAKEKEIENVETRVENSTLIITNKGNFSSPVYVYVKNNSLESLESSGASDFKSTNVIKSENLNLTVSGSSNVSLKLETKKLKSSLSGASSVNLNGSADYLITELTSASTLKAYNFTSKNADIVTTGAATAKIYVTDKLRANASGASDIKIKGDPDDVTAETTTAASITRIKDMSSADGKSDNDTTTYNWKKKKIIVVNKEEDNYEHTDTTESSFYHWEGFSMGVNGFMSAPGDINIPDKYSYMDVNYGRSFNLQFNIIEKQFKLVQNYLKVVTGFGFDYHSYQFANKTTLNPDSSFTWGTIDSTNSFVYKKNRLRCTYLQVPLLIELNTSNDPDKAVHIAFGVIGQYLITSRTKQELEQDKNDFSKVRKDSYNMSPFAAKAHVNVGYRGFTVFGEYSLTPLFQSGKGPELYPFTAGIRLVPFG